MKRIVALLLLSALVAACTPAAAPTATVVPTAPSAKKKIALVMKTLTNPFFIEMERGARRAEKEFDIQLMVRTANQETSIQQQIEIIEELTRQKVDAIVIAPGDSKELIPVLKKAQDAGIPVVNIDNRLDPATSAQLGLKDVPFVSVNNEQGAYLAAKYMSDQIKAPTDVLILEGIRAAQNAQDRKNGALRAFKENSNITVVATETANWKIDEALTVTTAQFVKFPNIKAIFAANDVMALGAVQYVKQAKKTDVIVGGYDALQEAKDAIKAGEMVVTVDQQAAEQGYIGVKLAVGMLKGEKPGAETIVDVLVVNKANVK
jgi:ribose transport system substrate-binding protein